MTQMDTNFMQIEVFQVSTVTKMEQNRNRHDFTLRENALSVSSSLSGGRDQGMIGHFFLEILIEFIYNTENFCNFGFGYHHFICCIFLIFNYKFTQISCDSQFLKYLFTTFLIPNSSKISYEFSFEIGFCVFFKMYLRDLLHRYQ